ncbi:hypothetical protein C1645_805785 [Glomus cerebriforme]|uniref:Uncharacterized protein n=1 Tax=Glomus cerebriforme TaxID=658196 RepID=A0A397SWJ5_9GLOM|nr:hypothetical protein C1645_805785 [Glomus cerebriforme]
MSKFGIPSHLILTPEQKKQLCSLPVSKFTDIKWESQSNAVSFLKEHDLILENRPERKWKVRYSNKSKGIYLLQCCCGSDMSLKQKKDKAKIRKSRQMYKFVGCLAFARIKKNKDNYVNIYGYLSHLEDCQRQPNAYLIFCKFYIELLSSEGEFEKHVQKAPKFWNYLPIDLKNSFRKYAYNAKLLNELQLL